MPLPLRRTLTAVSVAALIGLAGCGADDEDEPTPGPAATTATPTTPAPATTTTEAPSPSVDPAALARAGVLELSDLPAGWKSDGDDNEGNRAQCPSVRGPREAAAARENSESFEGGPRDFSFVENAVWVYADVAEAREQFRVLAQDETSQCLVDELSKNFDQDDTQIVGTPQILPLDAGPLGEERFSARLNIRFTAQGQRGTVSADIVGARQGQALSLMTFGQVLGTVDSSLRTEVAQVLVRKLQEAQSG